MSRCAPRRKLSRPVGVEAVLVVARAGQPFTPRDIPGLIADGARRAINRLLREGRLEPVTGRTETYRLASVVADTLETRQEAAWRAIRTAPGTITIRDIRDHSGLNFNQAKRYLSALAGAGFIRRIGNDQMARYALVINQPTPPDLAKIRADQRSALDNLVAHADAIVRDAHAVMSSAADLRAAAVELQSSTEAGGGDRPRTPAKGKKVR